MGGAFSNFREMLIPDPVFTGNDNKRRMIQRKNDEPYNSYEIVVLLIILVITYYLSKVGLLCFNTVCITIFKNVHKNKGSESPYKTICVCQSCGVTHLSNRRSACSRPLGAHARCVL